MLNKASKRKANQEKKNKYESKSLTRIVISLFVAIIAWIGATSFESYLLSDKNVSTVIVAAKDVETGTLIDESNRDQYFTTKTVNSNLVTKNTITNLEDVGGKVSSMITSGEIVTTNRFYDTSYVNDSFVDPAEITFTVANADKAVCGRVRKGDLVDIIAITEETNENGVKEKKSRTIMHDIYIVDAYDGSGNLIAEDDTTSQAISFKIFVERKDAAMYSMSLSSSAVTVAKVAAD